MASAFRDPKISDYLLAAIRVSVNSQTQAYYKLQIVELQRIFRVKAE